MTSHRIVSLIPSGTELVAALGCSDQLVGRSHECDFPPEIRSLPVCSLARIDVHAGSLEIDRQVRGQLRDALSVFQVLREELERLQPTLIVTQTQCEVCAVSLRDVQDALCETIASQPQILSLEPLELGDLWGDIDRVGSALGVEDVAAKVTEELQLRMAQVKQQAATGRHRPRMFCLEWIDPLMSAGNWVPELVTIAGGIPLLCERGTHSPYISWEHLQEADPEIVVVMPCGFDISRARSELDEYRTHPVWQKLSAVRNGHVYVTDGNQYFNRPGPRLADSAEILSEILQDAGFLERVDRWQHRGRGWVRDGDEVATAGHLR